MYDIIIYVRPLPCHTFGEDGKKINDRFFSAFCQTIPLFHPKKQGTIPHISPMLFFFYKKKNRRTKYKLLKNNILQKQLKSEK